MGDRILTLNLMGILGRVPSYKLHNGVGFLPFFVLMYGSEVGRVCTCIYNTEFLYLLVD